MKAKYIFASLVAALAVLAGCQKEETAHYLDEVQVSSSYVSVPLAGGANTMTVNATSSWTISGMPSWLTVSPTSGSTGETTVNFSALQPWTAAPPRSSLPATVPPSASM